MTNRPGQGVPARESKLYFFTVLETNLGIEQTEYIMGSNSLRLHRSGISSPEVIGVITCLGVGLLAGCWMFIKNTAEPGENLAAQNSTTDRLEVATATSSLSKEEAELRTIQQNIIKELNEAQSRSNSTAAQNDSLKPENHPIDHADIRDLLGESRSTLPNNEKASATKQEVNNGRTQTGSNGPQTLAYWNAMNNVMAEEESMRAAPTGGLTKENAADFIARRGQAGNYAASELRGLDRAGVDPAVVALGSDIASWYERGTQLNDRANYLLNQASDETRRGQTGKNWGESEKSHNASVAEINRRGDALRVQMSQKYRLKFPDLR